MSGRGCVRGDRPSSAGPAIHPAEFPAAGFGRGASWRRGYGRCDTTRRKRDAAVCIIFNVIHRPLKHAGSQVFRIVYIAGSVIYIVEDAIHVPLIQLTERVTVALRRASQDVIFVDFGIRQGKILPAGLKIITPPGFRSCREYNMQRFKLIEGHPHVLGYN